MLTYNRSAPGQSPTGARKSRERGRTLFEIGKTWLGTGGDEERNTRGTQYTLGRGRACTQKELKKHHIGREKAGRVHENNTYAGDSS